MVTFGAIRFNHIGKVRFGFLGKASFGYLRVRFAYKVDDVQLLDRVL